MMMPQPTEPKGQVLPPYVVRSSLNARVSARASAGEKPSIADLPASATEGDAWLVAEHLHVWGGGRWIDAGPIRGPQGPQGERGPRGEKGDSGDVNNHQHPIDDVTGLSGRLAALERDTGWRSITALSPAGVLEDGAVSRLRRVGDIVYMEGYGLPGEVLKTVALASAHTFAELPLGFRAAGYTPARGTLSHAYGSSFGTIEFFADRAQPRLNMGGAAVGIYSGFLSWSVEFHTTDPWPTSLPG